MEMHACNWACHNVAGIAIVINPDVASELHAALLSTVAAVARKYLSGTCAKHKQCLACIALV